MKGRNLLINPDFQWKIINLVAILYSAISLLYYLANFILFRKIIIFAKELNLPITSPFFNSVNDLQQNSNICFVIFFIAGISIIYFLGFLLSHRIAGPIYKISRTIDEIISERNSEKRSQIKIVTRANDFFPEHVKKINELTTFYENQLIKKEE